MARDVYGREANLHVLLIWLDWSSTTASSAASTSAAGSGAASSAPEALLSELRERPGRARPSDTAAPLGLSPLVAKTSRTCRCRQEPLS